MKLPILLLICMLIAYACLEFTQSPDPPVQPRPLMPTPEVQAQPVPTNGESFTLVLEHMIRRPGPPEVHSLDDEGGLATMSRFEGWEGIGYTHEARKGQTGAALFTMSLGRDRPFPMGMERGPEFERALKARKVPLVNYAYYLHSLGEGDVFPLPNGMLFCATAIDMEKKQTNVEFIPPGSFPGAPWISKRCRLLVFSPHGTILSSEYDIRVKDLNARTAVKHPETGVEIESPVVEVMLRYKPASGILHRAKVDMVMQKQLTIGSYFQLGGIRYPVKNIVLPDPEKKIIGWVELEMPEFDEEAEVTRWKEEQAEWVKRWGPIVRP